MIVRAITWALRRWRLRRLRELPRAQALGPLAEQLAADYLERSGFRIHARNWRPGTGTGELDIVASERGVLVFVEVKARSSDAFGAPERAIGEEKRRRMGAAARRFCRVHAHGPRLVRFDTVSVLWPGPLDQPGTAFLDHVRDAFLPSGARVEPFPTHIAEAMQTRFEQECGAGSERRIRSGGRASL